MKKILTTVFGILVGAAAITALYRFCFRKSIPEAPAEVQIASILKQNDCFVCHSSTPQLPFYASFPVIGPMMDQHVDHAKRFVNLDAIADNVGSIDEVTLAKLEYAIAYETMPIVQYKMIHWGTGFNKKEKAVLADWINGRRAECPAFSPIPETIPYDEAKAVLGEKMFNDGRISLDGTISCASCHILETGGADAADYRTSEGINGQFGGVNAPTVYNAFYNIQQFWNGRAADLQEQAAGPPVNPVEMGDQTWAQIVERLRKDKALVKEFEKLYPGEGLTETTVTGAIAEFEKKLITPGCRFDCYLNGDENALGEKEKAGFEAFKKNACSICHTGIILGGKSFEELGIFADYFADRKPEIAYNSDDDGLKGFTGKDADLHKFKVPGLRNVAITAPYFHDGSMETLEDAVKAMAKYEVGAELSKEDIESIVEFLKVQTGRNAHLNQ